MRKILLLFIFLSACDGGKSLPESPIDYKVLGTWVSQSDPSKSVEMEERGKSIAFKGSCSLQIGIYYLEDGSEAGPDFYKIGPAQSAGIAFSNGDFSVCSDFKFYQFIRMDSATCLTMRDAAGNSEQFCK